MVFSNRSEKPFIGSLPRDWPGYQLDTENADDFNPRGLEVLKVGGEKVNLETSSGIDVLTCGEFKGYLKPYQLAHIRESTSQILKWAKDTEWLRVSRASA